VNFSELKLNKQLLDAIEEAGFEETTPIQEKGIPFMLAGRDLIGIAQTGTGKTAAYVLPILMKVKYAQGSDPRALILVPTRELVLQVEENIKKLATYTDLRYTGVYGGVGKTAQMDIIAEGIDILVATPGRLIDIYMAGGVKLNKVKTFIIDEADRMMDMGFIPQIHQILEIVPRKRQNLLFSATFPAKVEELTQDFVSFPERIEIAPQATTVETIEQYYYETPNLQTKINLAKHLLQDEAFERVMIFAGTKKTAEAISEDFKKSRLLDFKIIHSNKGQNTRINAMNEFKAGNVRILIATDVSARGIDVEKVSHVINFNTPTQYEDYVHRVGRTGRAKNEGIAISFIADDDKYHLRKIQTLIQKDITKLELPEEVEVTWTPHEERQLILRNIDTQRKKDDPSFKGAFHPKKNRFDKPKSKSNNKRSSSGKSGKRKSGKR
jgi:ATP-dependent RNA helicase RhlE